MARNAGKIPAREVKLSSGKLRVPKKQFTVDDYNRINNAYLLKKKNEEITKLKIGKQNLERRLTGKSQPLKEVSVLQRTRRSAQIRREDVARTKVHPIREQIKIASKSGKNVEHSANKTPLRSTSDYQKQADIDKQKIKDELWKDPVKRKQWAESQMREEIRASKTIKSEASRLKHAGSLHERLKLYAELDDEQIARIASDAEVKQVPTKKTYKQVPKNINAVPKAKAPHGGQLVGQASPKPKSPRIYNMQYSSDTTPLSSSVSIPKRAESKMSRIRRLVRGEEVEFNTPRLDKVINKTKQIVGQLTRNTTEGTIEIKIPIPDRAITAGRTAGRIASRVASSGIMRAAGTAGLVMGAASDIMNISRASREIGRAVRYKGVEAIPRTTTTNQQYANLKKAGTGGSIKTQAEMNTAVGKTYGWGAKSGTMNNPTYVNKPMNLSGVDTTTKKQRSVAKPRVLQNKRSKKPTVSTPIITPKRPEQIIHDMSFMSPLQIPMAKRVSPVRPIPTRVQMPEQFMSPSMKLASLPKINRYKLGVQR